jgi:3-oxoacyl-[acyl-carrier protein] reductase
MIESKGERMTTELAGRRVIICGAAGGIGAAAVRGFLDRGAAVAAVYNTSPPPADLAGATRWYQCDVSKKRAVDALFDQIAKDLGGIDALIQPAGTWRAMPPEDANEENIDFLLSVNFKSTVFTNQAAFRHMKERGGRIVNFGSVEGVEGSPVSPVYAATRAAVQAWTRSAARAWGKYHINVNAIAPIMHTGLYEYALTRMTGEQLAAHDKDLAARIPIDGKFGQPLRDCVPMLAFLAGEGSRYVTGQLIAVDGGMMMMGA